MTPGEWRIIPSDDDGQPSLPYGGDEPNSGWSGSETSRARAAEADTTGVTGRRQRQTLAQLHDAGARGLTWRELAEALGLHHGGASGVLSVLHMTGRIARLTETRRRCKVYVATEYVNERPTERHGRTAASGLLDRAVELLRYVGPCPTHPGWDDTDCWYCRANRVVNEYERRSE